MRRVACIYKHNQHAFSLGFVEEELCQLRETPSVERTTLLLTVFAAVSYSFEIFEGKGVTRFKRSQDRIGNEMVVSSLKPFPTTRHLLEMSFRVLGAFGLQERA